MEWQDEGFILYTQPLGERKQIVSLFTQTHGRYAGVFSLTQKNKAWIQCGAKVNARWGARLDAHIGYWNFELLPTKLVLLLDQPGPLAALSSITSLCHLVLPERHAYPFLYENFSDLLEALSSPEWAEAYVNFEITLLEELGYGLELHSCAVTGSTEDLVAVSPRTGRAVCEATAAPYQGKLLSLPAFLTEKSRKIVPNDKEILDGLRLTGYFLERYLLGRTLPAARERLIQRFSIVRNAS